MPKRSSGKASSNSSLAEKTSSGGRWSDKEWERTCQYLQTLDIPKAINTVCESSIPYIERKEFDGYVCLWASKVMCDSGVFFASKCVHSYHHADRLSITKQKADFFIINIFTPNTFDTKQLLHQTIFWPEAFYKRTHLDTTDTLSPEIVFTPTAYTRQLYTKLHLHQKIFWNFCTGKLLHQKTPTPNSLDTRSYTKKLLHQKTLTPKDSCTKQFFTQEDVYTTKQLLIVFTPELLYIVDTWRLLHQTTLTGCTHAISLFGTEEIPYWMIHSQGDQSQAVSAVGNLKITKRMGRE